MPRARVRDLMPAELVDRLLDVDVLEAHGGMLRSNVLVTTWAGRLFVSDPTRFQHHAEYAYSGRSSFTPVELLSALGWRAPAGDPTAPRRLLDLGCGSGLGAVAAAAAGVEDVLGTDVVERCLRFARLNAALNDASNTEFRYSDVFANIDGEFDLVISNTPCVWDELQQATFATGGGSFGNDLPMRMIGEALDHLRPQGLLVAVVAAPIVRGQPYIAEVIERTCGDRGVNVRVEPLIAEFEFEHAATYRSHGISAFVRYVVTISPSARFSMSFAPGDRFRFGCYRARAASVRLVAAVTRFAAPPATTPLG
jgi:SAM-dependent methyltransferase